jgi:bacillithiol biosynthesis cysteine-adding enzyme BshC
MNNTQAQKLSYEATGYFDQIVLDYISGATPLSSFYHLPPTVDAFEKAIANRNFPNAHRGILSNVLEQQYRNSDIDVGQFQAVADNIALLRNENTFTITTGHQLCLNTGPLYFIYKIVSVINACRQLKQRYPAYEFVPVYWMATEDHDFEEVNHFHLFGDKFEWNTKASGPVGRLPLTGLEVLHASFSERLGSSEVAKELIELFEKSYLSSNNLAQATRLLVHSLFQGDGLVCVDADEPELKKLFADVMQDDLLNKQAASCVEQTNKVLGNHYKIQVNPREINLFYMEEGRRERIAQDGDDFVLVDSETKITKQNILELLDKHPERFSPNVMLRPLYQERILPNLAYIGGGGEIAYWLQLKSTFEHYKLSFPILLLRNSALWIDKGSVKKLRKNGVDDYTAVFTPIETLLKEVAQAASSVDLKLTDEETALKEFYAQLRKKAEEVDGSMVGYLKSEEQKALNNLGQIRGRLMKAEKRNNETAMNQLRSVKDKLFPGNGLQERYDNFATLYMSHGQAFIGLLKQHFDPFEFNFTVFYEEA